MRRFSRHHERGCRVSSAKRGHGRDRSEHGWGPSRDQRGCEASLQRTLGSSEGRERRERGQADTVAFLWGLLPFWALVIIIIFVALVGLRRSGAVLGTQEGGLVAGRAVSDPIARGELAVRDVVQTWWGGDLPDSLAVTEYGSWRSVSVGTTTEWNTPASNLLGLLNIRSGSFQRREAFYSGPPDEYE